MYILIIPMVCYIIMLLTTGLLVTLGVDIKSIDTVRDIHVIHTRYYNNPHTTLAKEKGNQMSKWTEALAAKGIDCKSWKRKGFEKVPADVWEDLLYEINKADLEYADNYRAYRWKDGLHIGSYKESCKQRLLW